MKISCIQEKLNKGLSLVNRIVSNRGSLPILSNVMLTSDKGRLKISATDLEIGINTWIGAKVEEEGSITVPARLISEFVNTNKDQTINMALNNNDLEIFSEKYKANIKGINASEFPLIPNIKKDIFASIDSQELNTALSEVYFAAAVDETRPVLTGILFKFIGGKLKIAATDSFRLAEKEIIFKDGSKQEKQIIIPQRAAIELIRIISNFSGKIDIYLEENQVLFTFGDTEFTTRLINGSYPDYEQIIPKKHQTEINITKNEFSDAIKMASYFARETANNIKIKTEESKLKISANSPQVGDNVSEINAQITGNACEIAINAKFALDFLNVIKDQNINIKINENNSPVLFSSQEKKGYLYIIMPLRVEE